MPLSRRAASVLAMLTLAVIGAGLFLGSVPHRHAPMPFRAESRNRAICGTYCDASPAALGRPWREADSTSIYGRLVQLALDDTDQTAFAVISNGARRDEVWLDRTWNGGKSWDSKIGDTRIRSGRTSATTTQWNLDKGKARAMVRACGKAGNRRHVTCTGWHPSQRLPERGTTWARGAVDSLMDLYDRRTGLWRGTRWWNSANAMTSLIDYMRTSHDRRYRWVLANTYDKDRSERGGNFTNSYLDDTGWWALAWIRAYDLTHRQRYLRTARIDVDHMWSYHDGACGGGVWWNTRKRYKNAITNELFIKAAAELHTRIPGDRTYLRRSRQTWRWFRDTGMINSHHLVNDGLDGSCKNNHGTTWTYNQGVILGGLVDLARATHRHQLLRRAEAMADASTRARALHHDGILSEPCEAAGCDHNGPTFKGVYVRNLGELAHATSSTSYRSYLRRQARATHDRDRTPYDQYGIRWTGPVGPITGATQQSAVDLMVADLH